MDTIKTWDIIKLLIELDKGSSYPRLDKFGGGRQIDYA